MPNHPTPHPNERWILWVLAGIQFSHIVDFMIMMPLGPQITQQFGIGDAAFGFLVSLTPGRRPFRAWWPRPLWTDLTASVCC